VGPIEPDICFIGEAPGADEDRTGKPFVGAAGQVLSGLLNDLGIDRSTVYITNLLKCRPPGNRKPEPSEMQNCREHLLRELDVVRPRGIVCLGAPASQGLLGTTEHIGRLRGRLHDFRGVPVLCTYHPAFLLPGRSPDKKSDVLNDIRLMLRRLGRA
jgi:DNA polymerase